MTKPTRTSPRRPVCESCSHFIWKKRKSGPVGYCTRAGQKINRQMLACCLYEPWADGQRHPED